MKISKDSAFWSRTRIVRMANLLGAAIAATIARATHLEQIEELRPRIFHPRPKTAPFRATGLEGGLHHPARLCRLGSRPARHAIVVHVLRRRIRQLLYRREKGRGVAIGHGEGQGRVLRDGGQRVGRRRQRLHRRIFLKRDRVRRRSGMWCGRGQRVGKQQGHESEVT